MTNVNHWKKIISTTFKSKKILPTHSYLEQFENGICNIVGNIKFMKHSFRSSPFQRKLRNTIKALKS